MSVDVQAIARAIGPERYERGRRLAWNRATREGSALSWTAEERDSGQELYDVVDEVLSAAFGESCVPSDMMAKTRFLYRDFPSYTILSQLFMSVGYGAFSQSEMDEHYRFLASMLSHERDELAQPAGYQLWVDFFENPDTVDAAWRVVAETVSNDRGTRRLLECSGPVPERLKLPLLQPCAASPAFHDAVFGALFAGVFDVYGEVSRSTVESLLPELRVDTGDPRYERLLDRLADPFPIRRGWRLERDAE